MRPLLSFGLAVTAVLCFLGWRRHSLRRAGPFGGYRCATCHRAFADLDEGGEMGNGYVPALRRTYKRENGGSLTRSGDWPS